MIGTLEKKITLDLEKAGVQARVYARQGDSLVHRIVIDLTAGGKAYRPDGVLLAQVYGLLPDGEVVSAESEIANGCAVFTPGGGFFAKGGPVLCRLIIRGDDGGELYSPAFAIDAEPCFAAKSDPTPAEEYSKLEEILLRILDAKRTCEAIAQEMREGDYSTPLSDSLPVMNGEASAGVAEDAARADHVHPTDTTRMPDITKMGLTTSYKNNDTFPIYDATNKTMKRMLFVRLIALLKESIAVPTVVSELTNDAGYITDTELDAALASLPAESWTFTLEDGSAVTKNVVVI